MYCFFRNCALIIPTVTVLGSKKIAVYILTPTHSQMDISTFVSPRERSPEVLCCNSMVIQGNAEHYYGLLPVILAEFRPKNGDTHDQSHLLYAVRSITCFIIAPIFIFWGLFLILLSFLARCMTFCIYDPLSDFYFTGENFILNTYYWLCDTYWGSFFRLFKSKKSSGT